MSTSISPPRPRRCTLRWPRTNTLTLDANGQPTDTGSAGVHLGLTEGPCSVSFNAKFSEIHADQFAAPIDAAYVSTEAEIDFAIKEFSLQKLAAYFFRPDHGKRISILPARLGRTRGRTFFELGNSPTQAANTHTVLLVAPAAMPPANTYTCSLIGRFWPGLGSWRWSARRRRCSKMKFKCIADAGRAAKDQKGAADRKNSVMWKTVVSD